MNSTSKKINGQRYGFDEYGRMIASWNTTSTPGEASQGQATYSSSFMYFSTPEDGARYTKGWFKVVPGYYLDSSKYDEDSEKWYYADGDGNIYASSIEKIKGKKYAFDGYGRMISLDVRPVTPETTVWMVPDTASVTWERRDAPGFGTVDACVEWPWGWMELLSVEPS